MDRKKTTTEESAAKRESIMTDWNVEEAKDSIKNGGRFGTKRVM